jgi:hypothetical protein
MFSAPLITREHIAYNRFPRLIRPKRPQAPKLLALVRARSVSTGAALRVNRVNLAFDRLWLAAPCAVAPRDANNGRKDPRIHQPSAAKQ